MRLARNERGFTLIELLVVVIIIGILAAIAIPTMSKQTNKAKIKRAVAELKSMKTIIDAYYTENSKVPKADTDNPDVSDTIGYVLQQQGVAFTGDENGLQDPWGNAYVYSVDDDTNLTAYKVICGGPDGKINEGGDDIYIDLDHNPVEGANQDNLAGTSAYSYKAAAQ